LQTRDCPRTESYEDRSGHHTRWALLEANANPPRFDALPEMVLVEEAAAFLRIGRNAAYELVKSGALRSVRYGAAFASPNRLCSRGADE
jgi:hypothetical protein